MGLEKYTVTKKAHYGFKTWNRGDIGLFDFGDKIPSWAIEGVHNLDGSKEIADGSFKDVFGDPIGLREKSKKEGGQKDATIKVSQSDEKIKEQNGDGQEGSGDEEKNEEKGNEEKGLGPELPSGVAKKADVPNTGLIDNNQGF